MKNFAFLFYFKSEANTRLMIPARTIEYDIKK